VVTAGATLLSLLLAVGWLDRPAALALAVAWFVALPVSVIAPGPIVIGLLLLYHALLPSAPYGAWAARDRPDPAGSWRLPAPLHAVAGGLFLLFYASSGVVKLVAGHPWPALAELAFPPLALVRPWRPWLWTLMLALEGALCAASGDWAPLPAVVFVGLFAFDPAWVKPTPPAARERLYYDGTCGLCHRAVRFLLAEDPSGRAFRFAPLDSETFRGLGGHLPRPLPDSLILETADGAFLMRSAAVLRALARLGGLWRLLAAAGGLIPTPLRDAAYDAVARVRYRLFARPAEACPVTPPHLRARFDP
jgi:predicted DCC family thiol-disulfide oxidoreductase YuxK